MEVQKMWQCNTCKTIVLSVDYPDIPWDDGHRCVFMPEEMSPAECENCGLETNQLTKLLKDPPSGKEHWFICKHCEGKLYQHEFRPHDTWKDLCRHCGKKFENDIHC